MPLRTHPRVMLAKPIHSHPTWKSYREIALYPSTHIRKSRRENSLYPSTLTRGLCRQCLYTLILFRSHTGKLPIRFPNHSKVMPMSPPVFFHKPLFESYV